MVYVNITYCDLGKLLELNESSRQKNIFDFQLQINKPEEPIFKIKRII